MKTIGITGGIGSGKSTISAYLSEQGYPVIDADRVARTLTEKGSPVLQELAATFGEDILRNDGTLDRKRLAALAFASRDRQQTLNAIMHSRIKEEILATQQMLRAAGEPLIFLDAPLLIESGLDGICDRIWVICASEQIKTERVMLRDRASAEEVQQRIALQMTDEERLSSSEKTMRIDNNEDKEGLCRNIDELLCKEKQ